MMQLPLINLLPSAIAELFAQVATTGVITKADRTIFLQGATLGQGYR